MKDREEAQVYAQSFGVAGDGQQGLGGGAEEDAVDNFFVVESNVGDRLGDSEDHVEVFHRQQLGLPLFEPLGARQTLALGTVPVAARAVLNVSVLAVAAPFDHTA